MNFLRVLFVILAVLFLSLHTDFLAYLLHFQYFLCLQRSVHIFIMLGLGGKDICFFLMRNLIEVCFDVLWGKMMDFCSFGIN